MEKHQYNLLASKFLHENIHFCNPNGKINKKVEVNNHVKTSNARH